MSRDKTVALSDNEKERLDGVRQEIYGTDEVPYGVVITDLIDYYDGDGDT